MMPLNNGARVPSSSSTRQSRQTLPIKVRKAMLRVSSTQSTGYPPSTAFHYLEFQHISHSCRRIKNNRTENNKSDGVIFVQTKNKTGITTKIIKKEDTIPSRVVLKIFNL